MGTVLPAAFLGIVVLLRITLFLRQRRCLRGQLLQQSLQSAGKRAVERALRLFRSELSRVLVASALLIVMAAGSLAGLSGTGLPVTMAVASCIAEVAIAAYTVRSNWHHRVGEILTGSVLAGGVGLLAAGWIRAWPWPTWLIPVALAQIAAAGAYQIGESVLLRPLREPRRPLCDGSLDAKLAQLSLDCGIKDCRFVVVNQPEIANARAESDPRGHRIVLWPGLLQRLGAQELEAVVVHELGHLRQRHFGTRFVLLAVLIPIATTISSLLAFGPWPPVEPMTNLHLATVVILLPVVLSGLRPIQLAQYRRQEMEADRFVLDRGKGQALAHALLRLSPTMAGEPVSDPWHALAYDSHPAGGVRMPRLRLSNRESNV